MSNFNDFFPKITDDLSVLSSLDDNVVPLVCASACSYILHGKDSSDCRKALGELVSITRDDSSMQKCVTGVACLYILACQQKNDIFGEIQESLQLPASTIKIIEDGYLKKKKELALVSEAYEGVEYRGLQWRLQTQVASRSQLTSVSPRALLRLQLCTAGEPISVALSSDIPNLVHWSEMIEQALAESRTQHARKAQRVVSSGMGKEGKELLGR